MLGHLVEAASHGHDAVELTVLRALAERCGWPAGAAQRAVEEFAVGDLGIRSSGATVRIGPRFREIHCCPSPVSPPPPPPPPDDDRPTLALLSLFTGLSTDRLALQRCLDQEGLRIRIVQAWSVEQNQALGRATEHYWRERTARTADAGLEWLADDVWNLMRAGGSLLRTTLGTIPRGALLLITAGSPCQQLTTAGVLGGRDGLLGDTSKLFWCAPWIAAMAQQWRPDLAVHLVVENAASALPLHRAAIREAMGIPAEWVAVLDSAAWTVCRRRRLYAASFPAGEAAAVPRRPPPWHHEWCRLHAEPLDAFTRSRRRSGETHIRASTWHYHPRHLLYHKGSMWPHVPQQSLERLVSERGPEELRAGWRFILTHGRQGAEADAERLTAWLASHEAELGFRTPGVEERSAALGLSELDAHLHLTEEERYNAQGNAMDPTALQLRLAPLLRAWAQDPAALPHHTFPAPHELLHPAERLRRDLLATYGPDGDGTLTESALHQAPLPFVNPTTGTVEHLDLPPPPTSGPGGRQGW